MATSNSVGHDDLIFQHSSCKILLKQGNLLDEKDVQFIVIPTPPSKESSPDSFAVYKEFSNKADNYLKNESDKIRKSLNPQQPKELMVKNHGYIFIILPYLRNESKAYSMVKSNYTACLKLAVEKNARSIAFPTIGCGGRGFEPHVVASLAFSAFGEFLEKKDKAKIDEIRLVVYSNDVWEHFARIFMESALEKTSKIKFIESVSKTSIVADRSQEKHNNQYPDDFENEDTTQSNQGKKITTRLDPSAHEFRPKSSTPTRDPRRYYINKKNTELHIIQGDILKTTVDAVVNAANEWMLGGSGVDGMIHDAAGDKFLDACKRHKEIQPDVRLPTGRSRILLSYAMRSTTHYIINTAGPRYSDFTPSECKDKLSSCYKTSLQLANLYDLETIGFTAISCGIFGYPLDEGAQVALEAVNSHADRMKKIIFVLKEDHVYDAWVKNAKKLGFISMDQTDREPASRSTPSENPHHNTQPDEPKHSEQSKNRETGKSKHDEHSNKEHDEHSNKKHDEHSNKEHDEHSNKEHASNSEDTGNARHDSPKKPTTSEEKNNKRQNDQTSNWSPERHPPEANADTNAKKSLTGSGGVVGRGRGRDSTNKS